MKLLKRFCAITLFYGVFIGALLAQRTGASDDFGDFAVFALKAVTWLSLLLVTVGILVTSEVNLRLSLYKSRS